MEDDIFKVIHDSSSPRTIERRSSLTSKLIGNAREWIHGLNQRCPEKTEDIYARSYSSGDSFDGLSDLMFGRQRSKSISTDNPIKNRDAIIPGPLF